MKIPFKAYLHDDYNSGERADDLLDQAVEQGIIVDLNAEELAEKLGRPFYEVTLECEFDTETGEVTLIKANL